MGRRYAFSMLVGIGAFLVLAGCNLLESKVSYRFRMSVEGAHQGSAVYEIVATKDRRMLTSRR